LALPEDVQLEEEEEEQLEDIIQEVTTPVHKKHKPGRGRKISGHVRKKNAEIIDPKEPKYCFCNRVAFGEMVACDNKDCALEWFHLGCVGLHRAPQGKWYCRNCTSLKRKR